MLNIFAACQITFDSQIQLTLQTLLVCRKKFSIPEPSLSPLPIQLAVHKFPCDLQSKSQCGNSPNASYF